MIRKFAFEADIYESLNCLPMAARRKLDALGIKVHLVQWEQFGRGERLMICHAPADTEEERSALRAYIEEVAVGDVLPNMPAHLDPDSWVPVPLEATYQATWTSCPEDMRALVEQGEPMSDESAE